MDENDFKRLLEESAAETHRRMDERFDQVDLRFGEVDARGAGLKQHIDNMRRK
jgi:hypothetical protein